MHCTVKNFGSFVHTGNDEIVSVRKRDFLFEIKDGRRVSSISGPQKVAG